MSNINNKKKGLHGEADLITRVEELEKILFDRSYKMINKNLKWLLKY